MTRTLAKWIAKSLLMVMVMFSRAVIQQNTSTNFVTSMHMAILHDWKSQNKYSKYGGKTFHLITIKMIH